MQINNYFRSEIIQGLKALPDMIRKVLEQDAKVLEIAKKLYEKRSLLIMGRGFNYATCLEGALKVNKSYFHITLCLELICNKILMVRNSCVGV